MENYMTKRIKTTHRKNKLDTITHFTMPIGPQFSIYFFTSIFVIFDSAIRILLVPIIRKKKSKAAIDQGRARLQYSFVLSHGQSRRVIHCTHPPTHNVSLRASFPSSTAGRRVRPRDTILPTWRSPDTRASISNTSHGHFSTLALFSARPLAHPRRLIESQRRASISAFFLGRKDRDALSISRITIVEAIKSTFFVPARSGRFRRGG